MVHAGARGDTAEQVTSVFRYRKSNSIFFLGRINDPTA